MKEQLDWIPFYVSEIQRHSQYLSLENKGRLLDIICFVINADLDLKSDYKTILKNYNLADDNLLENLDRFFFFKYLHNLIEKQKNKRNVLRENSAKGGKSTKKRYKQKDSQMASQKDSLINSSSSSNSSSSFNSKEKEEKYAEAYSEILGRKILSLSKKRLSSLNSFSKKFTLEQFNEGLQKVRDSDFLSKSSFCGFDWIINENNFIKIMEGNYDNKNNTGSFDGNTQKYPARKSTGDEIAEGIARLEAELASGSFQL